MTSFADRNRAAMNPGRTPGLVSSVDGSTAQSAYVQPDYATSVPDAPATQSSYVAPQPYVRPPAEQQWIAGVPNWLTGVTAVAVAYAGWKMMSGGERKNPWPVPVVRNKELQRRATKFFRDNDLMDSGTKFSDGKFPASNNEDFFDLFVNDISKKAERWLDSDVGRRLARESDLNFVVMEKDPSDWNATYHAGGGGDVLVSDMLTWPAAYRE